MKLGPKAMEALRAEVPGTIEAGEELVIAGPIALGGTEELTIRGYEKLRGQFAERFLRDARELPRNYGVREVLGESFAELLEDAGAKFVYEITEGGFLSALWKAAEVSDVGLSVDFRKVPIRQETIEVCEHFDVNPYRLLSGDCYLISLTGADALVQNLRRAGLMAEIIGQTNGGKDRLLYSGGSARYLDKPTEDEIRRVEIENG